MIPEHSEIKRRARFSYDDLPGLFTCMVSKFYELDAIPPLHSFHGASVHARAATLAEIAFLVAGLQYAPVLHHDAHLPCEAKRQQEPLHGCRQYFGRLHLPSKLSEVPFFVQFLLIPHVVCHRAFWPLGCRDPISVNFLGQGWMNIPRLWKTFSPSMLNISNHLSSSCTQQIFLSGEFDAPRVPQVLEAHAQISSD
jgi:hypothetical protein